MNGLPPLTAEQLRERAEALAQIQHHLVALGEPAWADVLLPWLHNYDGLELYTWPEDDPVFLVLNLLSSYVEQGRRLEPEAFAGDLASLSFCGLAARHEEGGPRWDPLNERFEDWTRGNIVRVWDAAEPGRVRDMVQTRLLLRFCRTRTENYRR